MKFKVDPQIFKYFAEMHLVIVLPESLRNDDQDGVVKNYWESAWNKVGELELPNAQSHPNVRQFRNQFQQIGISHKKYPTSIEALLRRALQGGECFSINPLVDFYNAVSLKNVVAIGAFDLEELESDIELRHTRIGDHFTELGQDTTLMLEAGEIAYTTSNTVLTRHFMWRQAQNGLISDTSQRIFIISEVPSVAGYEGALGVELELNSGLKKLFKVDSRTYILNREDTFLEF